jgi:AraC-like DNA-binding protein
MVATLLDPIERPRLDAAAAGRFATVHADTVAEAIRAVRERPVDAVLVSAGYVAREQIPGVATLVRAFPEVRTVAVVSRHDARSSERLLALGASGVRKVLDLTHQDGWRRLRDVITNPASPIAAVILGKVMPELTEAPEDCRACFEGMIRLAPGLTNVRAVSRRFGVQPSTFMSRFFRARLPSPKRYLAALRLLYVSAMLEVRGLSVSDVAYRLEYSSPQSFGRHLRALTGLTPSEFRRRTTFASAVDVFCARMIVPYRTTLRAFHPLNRNGVSALGHGA